MRLSSVALSWADRLTRHISHDVRCICGRCERRDVRSAGEHRPADVIPRPLIIKHELADRRRQLITLPSALELPCGLALAVRRGGTCGPDRIGGSPEFVRGNVG